VLDLIHRSNQLAVELAPPPDDAADVCPVCRSWREVDDRLCDNCTENEEALERASVKVIPISLYRKPSKLRDWLTYYKPGDDEFHGEYGQLLATVIGRFTMEWGDDLVRFCGGLDSICVVPSTTRFPPHPLAAIVDQHIPDLAESRKELLTRGRGDLGHRVASVEGFVARDVSPEERVLLLDDVYTTGARAQSAAYELARVGAVVPGILVVGRRVNPDYRPEVAALWERQHEAGFDFTVMPWWCR
jgi:hypothetical protein